MSFYNLFFRLVAYAVGRFTKYQAKEFLWTGEGAYSSSPERLLDKVQKFYEREVDLKDERLTKSLCAKIEFEVMKRFLDKYLPSSGHILDIGCGTGLYLHYLANKGYCVSGIDLSKPAVERARGYLTKSGLIGKVDYIDQGNALDLSMFPTGSFDAVLSFGPFGHILDIKLREHALAEIARVIKPGGLVFATFLSRFAPVILGLELHPYFFNESTFSESLRTGIRFAGGSRYWTDIYTAYPEDVKTFFVKRDFRMLCLVAVEGLAAWRVWAIERGFRDETTFHNLIDTLVSIAEEPSLLGATIQMLYVGERQ